MVTTRKVRPVIAKANSPVIKTGQNPPLKKRKTNALDVQTSQEKILLAARACFAKQGFAGTSMKDLQIASGFSRGNVYHHFATKEDIIQIIISQNLGKFCSQVENVLTKPDDSTHTLSDVICELASLAEEITKGPGKGMAFHVWSLAMVDPSVRQMMTQCFENIRSALEHKIIALQQQKKIAKTKHTQDLSVALFGLVIPAFILQSVYMDEKTLSAQAYSDSLELLFGKGV